MLEIGIGGYDRPHEGGTSLKMWNDFFPRGKIFGLDVHDKSSLRMPPRVHIFQGDQNDPEFLESFAAQWGPFDIIIDDGSHVSEHVITSFRALFPYVTDGGYYVVEDLFFSYDEELGGSPVHLDGLDTSMGLLKSLTDQMHAKYIPDREPADHGERIVAMSYYPKICFIRKGDNTKPDATVNAFYSRHNRRESREPTDGVVACSSTR